MIVHTIHIYNRKSAHNFMAELIYKSEMEAYEAAIKEFWKLNHELSDYIYCGSQKARVAFNNLTLNAQILVNRAFVKRYKRDIFECSSAIIDIDDGPFSFIIGATDDKIDDIDVLHEILSYFNEIVHTCDLKMTGSSNIYTVHIVPGELV